jgi:hypothetical protein
MAYDEKTAERVRRLLSTRSDVIEKQLMGGMCFMVKGHMCCAVSGRGGLLVRVGPDAYPSMLRESHAAAVEMRAPDDRLRARCAGRLSDRRRTEKVGHARRRIRRDAAQAHGRTKADKAQNAKTITIRSKHPLAIPTFLLFRALPDHAGKAFQRHQRLAGVGPFLQFLDCDVIERLPAGATRE